MRLLFAAILGALLPSIAVAQNSGVYIQAGPLLDTLFSSSIDSIPVDFGVYGSNVSYVWNDLNGDRRWQPGETGEPMVRGLPSFETRTSRERFAPGASVAVGVFITPSVSLRVEGSFQGEHVTTTDISPLTLSTPAATSHAAAITDVYVAAGWHQGASRRVSITYLGGMVLRRQREDTTSTYRFSVTQIISGRLTEVPLTQEQTFSSTVYGAGVMVGVDVSLNFSQRFAMVPQVRMVAANSSWNVRPAVVMRWRP